MERSFTLVELLAAATLTTCLAAAGVSMMSAMVHVGELQAESPWDRAAEMTFALIHETTIRHDSMVQPLERIDAQDGWLVIHHAVDRSSSFQFEDDTLSLEQHARAPRLLLGKLRNVSFRWNEETRLLGVELEPVIGEPVARVFSIGDQP